ncbi:MAG: hypothetical protein ACRCZ5_09770, partial [Burkholderiales bacterium]
LLRSVAPHYRRADDEGRTLIQAALAKLWHVPQLLQDLMDDNHPESPRTLNVTLAVALARHSADGWFNAALPDDLKAIQAFLRQDEWDVRRVIMRSILAAARSSAWYQWPPAASFLPLQPTE